MQACNHQAIVPKLDFPKQHRFCKSNLSHCFLGTAVSTCNIQPSLLHKQKYQLESCSWLISAKFLGLDTTLY